MAIHQQKIDPPANDETWELWCKKIFAKELRVQNLQRFGERGSDQEGIDLIGTNSAGRVVAVQCKLRSTARALTEKEAKADLARWKKSGQKLASFAIATTHRGKKLQKWAASQCKRGFEVKVYAWGDIEDILRTDSALCDELLGVSAANDSKHEQDYCTALVDRLNRMRLYAMEKASTEVKEPELTAAYVSLDLAAIDAGAEGRERGESMLSIEHVLDRLAPCSADAERDERAMARAGAPAGGDADLKRPRSSNVLLVVGEAGRGKTTLLRYIAVTAAKACLQPYDGPTHGLMAPGYAWPWRYRVPLYHEVRSATGKHPLSEVACLHLDIAASISSAIDSRWPHRVLSANRGLVLLDGVDEIPKGRERRDALEAIRTLIDSNPQTLFVISSRPAAAEEVRDALKHCRIQEARVNPLSGPKLAEFITHWHDAVQKAAGEQFAGKVRETRLKEIKEASGSLSEKLLEVPHIRALMATPLLAALVCAFHLEHGYLPKNRNELMGKLVECLIQKHDEHRPNMPPLPVYSGLGYDDKLSIVGPIAAEMVHGRCASVPYEPEDRGGCSLIDSHIGAFIDACSATTRRDLRQLRDGIVERTGLFQQPRRGALSFVHNEFRDFIAAEYLAPRIEIPQVRETVVEALKDPDWHGFVFFLVTARRTLQVRGFADRIVSKLLSRLTIRKGQARRKGARTADAEEQSRLLKSLRRLAFRIGGESANLSKSNARKLAKIREQIKNGLSIEDAELIAELGAGVASSLAFSPARTSKQRCACVKALQLIGGAKAQDALATYFEAEIEPGVASQLVETIAPTRIAAVRRLLERQEIALTYGDRRVISALLREGAGRFSEAKPLEAARLLSEIRGFLFASSARELTHVLKIARADGIQFSSRSLAIASGQVAKALIAELVAPQSAMRGLGRFDLSGSALTDSDVRELSRPDSAMKSLTSLDLGWTQISDAGLREISRPDSVLKSLTSLDISRTQISDAGLREISRPDSVLKSLTSLDISRTQISDAGLRELSRPNGALKSLKSLNIGSTQISDAGLRELARGDSGLRGLTELSLSVGKFAKATLTALKAARPILHIY